MISEHSQFIKQIIKEFFEKMGFEVAAEIQTFDEKTFNIKLSVEEPQILIGQNGQTLNDLRHIFKAILRRKIKEEFFLDLDINNYKTNKIEYLKKTARAIADEVIVTKKEKELEPMLAHERRIVHLELAQRNNIATESRGEGAERRIVIKPKN